MRRAALGLVLGVCAVGCGGAGANHTSPPAPIAPPPATVAASASAAPSASAPATATATADATPPIAPAPPSTPVVCAGRALVLVLDRSGSMSGLPMDAAKDAAKAAAKALPIGACFELLAFDSVVVDVVPLAPVDASAASALIDRLSPGGGTEFVSALEQSARSMRRVQGTNTKHVVFLSDGQAAKAGVLDAVAHLRSAGSTLSTIALGSSADGALLRDMADAGHASFYAVTDPSALARVFVREATN